MPSTFTGIEIGKRSLFAHQQGLHTVGHNLSNADKEGYSRQRVEMNPADPIFMPAMNREERPGQIGQGVEVERVERIKDMMLEGRIIAESSGQGYWESRDKYILMLEQLYNEPSDISVRSLCSGVIEILLFSTAHMSVPSSTSQCGSPRTIQ